MTHSMHRLAHLRYRTYVAYIVAAILFLGIVDLTGLPETPAVAVYSLILFGIEVAIFCMLYMRLHKPVPHAHKPTA